MSDKEWGIKIDWKDILLKTQSIFQSCKQERIEETGLNILIVGKTGAGKSTLINTVFGQEFTKTGSGKPITQEIEAHSDESGLTIYDTKGLEIGNQDAQEKIEKFLEGNLKKAFKDQIHIVWLCIGESTRRIEEAELELMYKLKEKNIPTIIVITKASQDKDSDGNKFSDIVKKEFQIEDNLLQRVRAIEIEDDDGDMKPTMGISELLKKSNALMKSEEGRANTMRRKQIYDLQMKKKALTEEALILIAKYSKGAAVFAGQPLPFSDIALLLPIQSAMIVHLNNLYGVKMDAEGMAKTAAALAGVAGLGFGLCYAVGSALKLIPTVGGVAGGAFNATVASAGTQAMGRAYLALFR